MFFHMLVGLLLAIPAYGQSPAVYRFNNQTYNAANLSPSLQQRLYEIELERYNSINRAISGEIIELQLKKDATSAKKSLADFRKQLFAVSNIPEKEIKDFYKENKHRIPYEYEKAKPQIQRYLTSKKSNEKRDAYLEKAKKIGKYTLVIAKPIAPSFTINVDGLPSKGATKAKVTIVEFSDYQCPHCKEANAVLNELLPKFKDKVKLIHADFPINRSGISKKVAHGAYCAHKQNNYWDYHNLAFAKQKELTNDSPLKLAMELKLDKQKFTNCLTSKEAITFVDQGLNEAQRLGIHGTPAIFVNGKKLIFSNLKEDLESAIKELL